ncbi:hypothetical protein DL96DRAFT_1821304 [Flagelloscypha sp. PMI_526]|nr:hypothetical protein DL96DRAFT_1821304 [Flagelloscypha sp. PMI_526]
MRPHRSRHHRTEREPLFSQDNRYASGPPPYSPNDTGAQEPNAEPMPMKTATGKAFIRPLIIGVFILMIILLYFARRTHYLNEWERSLTQQSEIIRLDRQHWHEERDRREEEERQDRIQREKAGLRWVDLAPEKKCLSYGRRMYTAKMAHVPDHAPKDEWCWTVPIKIHEDVFDQPEWCGTKDGEFYGQWYVDKNEPSCRTWFQIIDGEETCVHGVSHTRRYFGKLENFNREDWDNWRLMCTTTPFKVHNLTFERPHQCGFRGLTWVGAWGTVDVPDKTCPE